MKIPVMTRLDESVAWFVARNEPLTEDEWSTAAGGVGRNDSPALLYDLTRGIPLLHGDVLAYAVADAWSSAEWPTRLLDPDEWRDLFAEGGYTVDGRRAERPSEPVTLYRGATSEGRNGMSWTTDRSMAEFFASRPLSLYAGARVWVATIDPGWILAELHESRRESEYVVDPEAPIEVHPA